MQQVVAPTGIEPCLSPFKEGVLPSAHTVYDYIFTGSGCAALSLLMHLNEAGLLQDKKVLVIDCDEKNSNDRTWCFWEAAPGLFEPVVYKSWQQLSFFAPSFSRSLQIAPYTYKLIRGSDFYAYCFRHLCRLPQISWLKARVDAVDNSGNAAMVQAGNIQYSGKLVFNSIMSSQPILHRNEYWLLQHFKGWIVETDSDVFDPQNATLMDFRVGQEQGCTFVYVLPFSRRRALVEYTLFSKTLLPDKAYDVGLHDHMTRYVGTNRYTVTDVEFGVIPMTNYAFPKREGQVLHIGTAGGYTKASSGYTFRFIQKNAARITTSIQKHGHPFAAGTEPGRFHFYDSVLLNLLHRGTLAGATVFTEMFKHNKAAQVLKFLDNETSLPEELRLISSLPILPFSDAALHYVRSSLVRDK